MTNHLINSLEKTLPKDVNEKKDVADRNWTIWNIGAGVGLLGGLCVFAVAVVHTFCQYFYREKPRGSWLLLAVLPLWVAGAYCFDKIEEAENSRPA